MKLVTTLDATPDELIELAEKGLNKAAELYVAVLAELNKQPTEVAPEAATAAAAAPETIISATPAPQAERPTISFPKIKSMDEIKWDDPAVSAALQKAATDYNTKMTDFFMNAERYDPRPRPMAMPNQVPYLKREADPVPASEPEVPQPLDEVDEFIRLKLEVQERLAGLQGNARTMFDKGVMRLFEKHPELHIISWKQYVPSFNDGDPCTFSMHDQCVNGITENGYTSDDDMTDYLNEDDNPDVLDKVEAFQEAAGKIIEGVEYSKHEEAIAAAYPWFADVFKFLNAFTPGDYESMFDSNAEIHITRDEGVISSEYYCGY